MVNSTVQDTSIKEDIGYEAIMGIIDSYIERDINWEDVTRLEVIGLDEISLKKGHRDFVAIITGLGRPNRCFAVGRFFELKMPKPSFRCRVVPYFQGQGAPLGLTPEAHRDFHKLLMS